MAKPQIRGPEAATLKTPQGPRRLKPISLGTILPMKVPSTPPRTMDASCFHISAAVVQALSQPLFQQRSGDLYHDIPGSFLDATHTQARATREPTICDLFVCLCCLLVWPMLGMAQFAGLLPIG